MVAMVTRIALTGLASAVSVVSLTLTGPAGAAPALPTGIRPLEGRARPLEWGTGPLTVAALPRITYVAHRGGAREVPENSMTGLVAAYERGTAQVLDFDTRLLRDGTPVVFHDETLNRTTYLGGEVRGLDAREWRGVRLRPEDALPGSWRSERPPTVAEVLDRFGGRIVLMLEAKDPRSLGRLAGLIRARGLTRSVFVNSNDPEVARRVHRLGLLTQLWRSARQLRTDRPERWRSYVDLLDVDHRARDADLARAVKSGIRRVWAHTVVTDAQRDRVLALGCDGVITDAPGRLARAAQRGARP
ncbi:putative Glycerophosphoryl diester phosphodiesterase [Streptomyces afghaniensis 772]|uniref:Putative Glycerophosphoryl diester phosphodiesterase n=2 Tax=Streptomyces TaxID=1883 RepID=S4N0Z7_9ACTN|nr:putative Glycerophosphoryl diester phosphodiesterase [Streptomyces afghaniensis 772]